MDRALFPLFVSKIPFFKQGTGRGVRKPTPRKRAAARSHAILPDGSHKPWFKATSVEPIKPEKSDQKPPVEREEETDEMDELFDTSQFLDEGASDDEGEPFSIAALSIDRTRMERIPSCQVTHWKHVVYNLLADNHNDARGHSFCSPYSVRQIDKNGNLVERVGFRFDIKQNPARKLAELWAFHEKRKQLEETKLTTVLREDLYKFYLRACLDLLAKYFIKLDKFTFLYDETPLFVPNGSLEDALLRLKKLPARGRKSKASCPKSSSPGASYSMRNDINLDEE
jgi:hypothetical protein